jgi:hypothetical protein
MGKKKLGDRDWHDLESARQRYVWQRKNVLSGVQFSSLKKQIEKIQKAGNALKLIMDLPHDATMSLSWRYIASNAPPGQHGSKFGRDEVYPVLSMLNARCFAALVHLEKEEQGGGWLSKVSPWNVLIDFLAGIFERNGWGVTNSNPRDGITRLSTFAAFVKAVRDTLPKDVRQHNTDTALAVAVGSALAERKTEKFRSLMAAP